jgi:hypothetical protein
VLHYKTRGPRVCNKRYQPPMAVLEELVLDAIESDLLAPAVVSAAIQKAAAILLTPERPDVGRNLARQIAELDREIEQFTTAIIAGGADIPAVLAALRTRQVRRQLGQRDGTIASGAHASGLHAGH